MSFRCNLTLRLLAYAFALVLLMLLAGCPIPRDAHPERSPQHTTCRYSEDPNLNTCPIPSPGLQTGRQPAPTATPEGRK